MAAGRPGRQAGPGRGPGRGGTAVRAVATRGPGILTADQIVATGRSIAAVQQHDGAIGWPDGHVDAWNHVECVMALSACGLRDAARRGYDWLRAAQRPDGSWPKRWADGSVIDDSAESNHAAYPAVGVWQELQVTRDEAFAARMWPVVRDGIEFALGLQLPRGEIIWRRGADGTPGDYALLTGCSSMYQACAAPSRWPTTSASRSPTGSSRPASSGTWWPVTRRPSPTRAGSRWTGTTRCSAARCGAPRRGERLAAGWDTFVVPGLGIRCVSDQPWVTGAETCELAIALDAIGDRSRALDLFAQIQHLRDPSGSLLDRLAVRQPGPLPPNEQSSWTSAAVILAADTLSGATGGSGMFPRPRPGGPWARPSTPPRAAARCRRPGCRRRAQPIPGPVRSSTRSEPSTRTSVNAPDFSARR